MSHEEPQLGYARATGPQAASTIHTSGDGLDGGRVAVPAGDRDIPAYYAHPAGDPGRPLVLVLGEAFGLHEHIADVVRRFAHAGYFAVAPDLMVRQGDPQAFEDIDALVSDLLLTIPDEQVMGDLDATFAWAASQGADTTRSAATGFCWGGRWTWLYAAHRGLDAAVAWYGIVDGTSTFPADPARFPQHPLDVAGALKTPVLGLYGAQDDAIPVAGVEAMRTRLAAGSTAAQASNIIIYEAAGHAFFADYRPSYVAEAAQAAWRECLQWLDRHLAR
jgi:carboxymethylenebutenolidase